MATFTQAPDFTESMAAKLNTLLVKKHCNGIAKYSNSVGLEKIFFPFIFHVFTIGNNGYLLLFPQPVEEGRLIALPVKDEGEQYFFFGAYSLYYGNIGF